MNKLKLSDDAKRTTEIIKTVIITILITANIAFIGGMQYQKKQDNNVNNAVQQQVERLKASAPQQR